MEATELVEVITLVLWYLYIQFPNFERLQK